MPQFLLIGLCEPPSQKDQAAFNEWFVDQHIEDTTHCPNFIRGRVFKLAGPHLDGKTVSNYISVYEVEAPSYAEAERVLNEWQANPKAWSGRAHHLATAKKFGSMPLKVNGSGWYELLKSFDRPKAG
ncbi:MAG: hypothetical protein FJ194_16645 [Gammaproteobacteria bacterium]|nr:hypothetical protein [Gammaproteobacteria bacterium]